MANTDEQKITPKKKAKLKKKITYKKEEILTFLNKVYLGEDTYNKMTKKTVNFVRVVIVSIKKFFTDDCFTKASSIAYTVIISLIPTLTVMLTIYSALNRVQDKKNQFFTDIKLFMLEHNIGVDITNITNALSLLIDNATRIGIVGGVAVIFSATAMLRSLEKSLNHIWKVKKQRPFFLKIVYYWTALSLGPILIGAGTTAASRIFDIFSSPHINNISVTDKKHTIAVGDKATLYIGKLNDKDFLHKITVENINFENQKFYKWDSATKTFQIEDNPLADIAFNKYNITDVTFSGKMGWAVGSGGLLLESSDYGKTWKINRIDRFDYNAIAIINNTTIIIAGDRGVILRSTIGMNNWEKVPINDLNVNLNSISTYKNKGIICGNGGYIVTTNDNGQTWNKTKLHESLYKDNYLHLNNAFFVNADKIWIVGNYGLILNSNNGGKNWKKQKYSGTYNFQTTFFFNSTEGFIGGSRGTLLYTKDGGTNWKRITLPTYKINKLIFNNDKLIAVGNAGMYMESSDRGLSWSGIEGKSILATTLNFFAPFIFIWLFFLMCYKTLPNMKIPFKHAAIGSAVTAAIWVIFILIFIVYVNAFARITFAIYNTLAAIPLFLVMIYMSSVIILFGAEIAYTLMHPDSYKSLHKTYKDRNDIVSYYGISLLHNVYKKFESGKGGTYFNEMLDLTAQRAEQVDYFTLLFQKQGYIIQQVDNSYIPANSSKNIKISEVLSHIHDINLDIPATGQGAGLKKYMRDLFSQINKSRNKILSDLTLKDIIDNT